VLIVLEQLRLVHQQEHLSGIAQLHLQQRQVNLLAFMQQHLRSYDYV